MKKFFVIFTLLLLPICFAKQITVPEGTTVLINAKKLTHSRHLPKTYEIKAIVSNNVTVNDFVIANINNPAILKVSEHKKAKCFGRGGKISIDGAVFYDNAGNTHKLEIKETFTGDNDIWLTRIIPFNKGKQATILPSYIFETKTTDSFKYNTESPNIDYRERKR